MGVSLSLPSFSPRPETDRVSLRMVSSTQSRLAWWRSSQVVIDDKGAIIHGLNQRAHSVDIGQEYEEFMGVTVPRIPLLDPSASQLLVARANGSFFLVPPPEKFSRHLGAALIIGDRQHNCGPYALKLGDVIRLGSVGLFVMELRKPNGTTERVCERDLLFLKDHGDELRTILFDEAAVTAKADMNAHRGDENSQPIKATATAAVASQQKTDLSDDEGMGGSRSHPICYMCFEHDDQADNALIAPCDCRGDTKYVHVRCLRKWNDVHVEEGAAVLSTAQGSASCKVCKRRYKQHVMMPDGSVEPVLFQALPAPAVTFVIITKHDNNRALFGTQYQVGLSRTGKTKMCSSGAAAPAATLGRSHQCDMVVNYRTVSTQHARLYFEGGEFYVEDLNSSNGTSLFLRRPLELPTRGTMKVKLGRTTMLLRFQRSYHFFSYRGDRETSAKVADSSQMIDPLPETERSTTSSSPRNGEIAPVKLRRYATRDFLERLTLLDGRRTMSADSGMRLMGAHHQRFQIRDLQPADDANQILGENGTVLESDVVFERARAMTATGGFARRRGGHDIETISSLSSPSNVTERTRNRTVVPAFGRGRVETAAEVDNLSVRRSDHSEQSMFLDEPHEQLPEIPQAQADLC